MKRKFTKYPQGYVRADSSYGMYVHPDDADGQYSVAKRGDWKAYNWEDDAWGRLMSYDKTTKLYTVQWPDGHTSQHEGWDLMTIERANEDNRKYWECGN